MSNPQEFSKIDWIRVQIGDKVKRIYDPSKDLKCLANQIKSHFKELNGFVLRCSPDLIEKEFYLESTSPMGDSIVLSNNLQLEEIYMRCQLAANQKKVPRLRIFIDFEANH